MMEAPMGQPCVLQKKDSAIGEEIVASMHRYGLLSM